MAAYYNYRRHFEVIDTLAANAAEDQEIDRYIYGVKCIKD